MFDKICCGILFACGIDTLLSIHKIQNDKISVIIYFIIACINFIWVINLLENILKR